MNAGVCPSTSRVILARAFAATIRRAKAWLCRTRWAAPVPKPQAAGNASVILVLVTGAPSTTHALRMACLLAEERAAEIVLAFIIVVPLSLPLDASIEEMETASARALATARDTVRPQGVPVRLLVRHGRSMASGLLAAVQESHPDLMVIGIGPSPEDARWGEMVEKVAQRAQCEVIIDRVPGSAASEGTRLSSTPDA